MILRLWVYGERLWATVMFAALKFLRRSRVYNSTLMQNMFDFHSYKTYDSCFEEAAFGRARRHSTFTTVERCAGL